MKFKDEKYHLTLNRDELNRIIKYLTGARNLFIDKDIPTIDVVNALMQIFAASAVLIALGIIREELYKK